MDELDNLKVIWADLNKRMTALEEGNKILLRQVKNNKYESAQEKLVKKYIKFIVIEIIMIFYIVIYICFAPNLVEKYKLVTLIYWCVFFLIEVCLDYYLMQNIKNMDIYNSSVNQISRFAARNWKIHKIAIITGLPIAFGAIILLGLMMDANIYTIYGMIAGGVLGAMIGFYQLMKFMNYYKLLKSEDKPIE